MSRGAGYFRGAGGNSKLPSLSNLTPQRSVAAGVGTRPQTSGVGTRPGTTGGTPVAPQTSGVGTRPVTTGGTPTAGVGAKPQTPGGGSRPVTAESEAAKIAKNTDTNFKLEQNFSSSKIDSINDLDDLDKLTKDFDKLFKNTDGLTDTTKNELINTRNKLNMRKGDIENTLKVKVFIQEQQLKANQLGDRLKQLTTQSKTATGNELNQIMDEITNITDDLEKTQRQIVRNTSRAQGKLSPIPGKPATAPEGKPATAPKGKPATAPEQEIENAKQKFEETINNANEVLNQNNLPVSRKLETQKTDSSKTKDSIENKNNQVISQEDIDVALKQQVKEKFDDVLNDNNLGSRLGPEQLAETQSGVNQLNNTLEKTSKGYLEKLKSLKPLGLSIAAAGVITTLIFFAQAKADVQSNTDYTITSIKKQSDNLTRIDFKPLDTFIENSNVQISNSNSYPPVNGFYKIQKPGPGFFYIEVSIIDSGDAGKIKYITNFEEQFNKISNDTISPFQDEIDNPDKYNVDLSQYSPIQQNKILGLDQNTFIIIIVAVVFLLILCSSSSMFLFGGDNSDSYDIAPQPIYYQ